MEKYSEPGGGDEFEAIVAGIEDENDAETRREQYFDAGVLEFLAACQQIQDLISSGKQIDAERTSNDLVTLWYGIVGEGVPFTLTAKLSDDFDYPTLATTDPGSDIVAARVVLEDFMINDGVVAMVVESVDDGNEEDCLTVYLDDIQFIELDQPTDQERTAILRHSYPQIFAKIEQIPSKSEDDQEIIKYLKSLHLDLTSGPDSLATTAEKFTYSLTDLLNQHLVFDSAPYQIEINGPIIGRDHEQDLLRFDFAGQLPGVTVHQIEIIDPDPYSDGVESEIVLTVTYPVAGIRNGVTTLFLPVSSINDLTSTRPLDNPLANSSELATLIEKPYDQTGAIDVPLGQVAATPQTTPEIEGMGATEQRRQLEAYQKQLDTLFNIINQFTNKTYPDFDAARLAAEDLANQAGDLDINFEDNLFTVRVRAIGIQADVVERQIPGELTDEDEPPLNLTFTRQTLEGLSERTGVFAGKVSVMIIAQDDESYQLVVYADIVTRGLVTYPSSDTPRTVNYSTFEHVPVDRNFSYELDMLTNLQQLDATVTNIESYARQSPMIAEYLTRLLEFVRADVSSEFANIDPDIIEGIIRNTGDDPEAVEHVSELLTGIIGNRMVLIEPSPSKLRLMDAEQPQYIIGSLVHVVPINPTTKQAAINLVIDSGKNDLRYIDLTDIATLSI